MISKSTPFAAAVLAVAALAAPLGAHAQQAESVYGRPASGEIGFQQSVTPIMDATTVFHNYLLLWIIGAIVALVMVLLLWIIVRYNHRANPTPARFTHNTVIEVIWTVVPIAILIFIAIPSFGVLSDQETMPDGTRMYLGSSIFSRAGGEAIPAPELTIKATGHQWYWSYNYMDSAGVGFDSIILSDEQRAAQKPDQPRLLAVDYELVVPVDTTVRVQVTADDVIHSFAVPSFGIKIDAVPGRLSETWFRVRKTGIFYGQCSELCGKDHAFMPIAVRVVDKAEFDQWLASMQSSGDPDAANMLLAATD